EKRLQEADDLPAVAAGARDLGQSEGVLLGGVEVARADLEILRIAFEGDVALFGAPGVLEEPAGIAVDLNHMGEVEGAGRRDDDDEAPDQQAQIQATSHGEGSTGAGRVPLEV